MADVEDRFPEGLRVLVVDDNLTCLKILELLLQRCKYKVTRTQEATEALKMLTENPKEYDIVISDVHMPVMDGFQLLEYIGLHMDIPVIMLSANGDNTQVMKGITHGEVDYLIKPVRTEELQNIWQHIVRRKRQDMEKGETIATEEEGSDKSNDGKKITSRGPDSETRKRKRKDSDDDGDDEDGPKTDNYNPSGSKKKRVTWYPELHKKFVNAVDQLGGIENAGPKKITEIMNVEGLTREKVASHLQKYKAYMKRMTNPMAMGQSSYPSLTPFGAHNSSLFRLGGEMFDPYAPFRNLESSLPNGSMGMPLPFNHNTMNGVVPERMTARTSNHPGGYIARIPSANQVQMNSNQVTTGGPSTQGVEGLHIQPPLPVQVQHSGYRPQSNIPNQQDQTKCMENRQNDNVIQAPPTNFNSRVHSTEFSRLPNVIERTLIDSPDTPSSQYPFPPVAQSAGFNTVELQEYGGEEINVVNTSNDNDQLHQWLGENSANPSGASANPTHGHLVGVNTSSGPQNIEAQTREAHTVLNVLNMDEEDYLIAEPNLFVGFHQNDNVSLEDIIRELQD